MSLFRRRRHFVEVDGERVELGARVAEVDPDVNAIVAEAARQVLGRHAERSLCLAIDHPDHDGGWFCDQPAGHHGCHASHGRNGAILRVWTNDMRPALGLERPCADTATSEGLRQQLVCALPTGHDGRHQALCGCNWDASGEVHDQ